MPGVSAPPTLPVLVRKASWVLRSDGSPHLHFHPLLNDSLNRLFYDHALINGTRVEDRHMFLSVRCPELKLPFLFVGVPCASAKSLSGSHSCEAEAEACRQIVSVLTRKNIPPSFLAIIAFYKEQLAQFAKTLEVDLDTVDSVQGCQENIIILLTTRSGFDADRGEFLNEPHRFNVVLTTYRHGQFVLGHEQSLQVSHTGMTSLGPQRSAIVCHCVTVSHRLTNPFSSSLKPKASDRRLREISAATTGLRPAPPSPFDPFGPSPLGPTPPPKILN
ncbi:hypothetical protein OSTOST_07736 [Ostertagia ostertagi]